MSQRAQADWKERTERMAKHTLTLQREQEHVRWIRSLGSTRSPNDRKQSRERWLKCDVISHSNKSDGLISHSKY
jgi:hypothetical protein